MSKSYAQGGGANQYRGSLAFVPTLERFATALGKKLEIRLV
jgi:hypothetical protein